MKEKEKETNKERERESEQSFRVLSPFPNVEEAQCDRSDSLI